ncbi:MAG: 1-deoxy-D-xylulose-5-phosphate synthase, partial [Defluviitaleaceae bacterium]|nr:1-deoxy-D-xylulose-5-phosphate synthase [Defluviitaleaceae bacterium]
QGKWEILEKGLDIAILAVGSMVEKAAQVHEKLTDRGISATLINPRFISPIPYEWLDALTKYSHVFTMEENVIKGGFGQSIALELQKKNDAAKVHVFGVDGVFPSQGKRQEIFEQLGLDAQSMYEKIMEILDA